MQLIRGNDMKELHKLQVNRNSRESINLTIQENRMRKYKHHDSSNKNERSTIFFTSQMSKNIMDN